LVYNREAGELHSPLLEFFIIESRESVGGYVKARRGWLAYLWAGWPIWGRGNDSGYRLLSTANDDFFAQFDLMEKP
jgi:hypothetical protein